MSLPYRSQCNFRQYKPPENKWRAFWLSLKKRFQKKHKLSYRNTNNFRINPYKRETAAKTNWRTRFAIIFLIVSIAAWICVLLYLPYFRINKIVYLGLNFIKKDEIESFLKNDILKSRWIFIGDNYFMVSAAKIQKELYKKYSLNSAVVKKKFPSELIVDLDEKISTIIYDNGFAYYLLDNEGGVWKYLSKAENPEKNIPEKISASASTPMPPAAAEISTNTPSGAVKSINNDDAKTHIPEYRKIKRNFGAYPIIYDTRNLPVAEDQKNIVNKKFIESVLSFLEMLQKEGIAEPRYLTMEHPLAGVLISTDQPWNIYFQPENNLNNQLTRLKALLKNNSAREYIDLRYDERVFWK